MKPIHLFWFLYTLAASCGMAASWLDSGAEGTLVAAAFSFGLAAFLRGMAILIRWRP